MPTIKDVFKQLIGMAFEGYGYDPEAASNMVQLMICMWTVGPFTG